MKKVLYGTTALVAAGLVAGEASAASGLKLGITGFYRNAIGGSFGNGPSTQTPTASAAASSTAGLGNFDRQDVSMRQEIRINFTGQTTLDNGITVGVLVGLNGENVAKSGSTTQVNRAYADFSGKFGLVRVGEANSALVTDCVVDPGNVTSNFGVNSPNESFSDVGYAQVRNQTQGTANVATRLAAYFSTFGVAPMGSIGTCFGIEGKGNKIMYFSPSFGGLTFGVSFTPTGGQRRAGGGLSYGTDVTAPGPGNAGNNILSVGVDYTHDFGGWNLTAGGGGEWAFTQYTPAGGNTNNKPSWYQAGMQIGFGHFAIGASGAYYVNYAACRLRGDHGDLGRRWLGGQRWCQLHPRCLVLRSPGRIRRTTSRALRGPGTRPPGIRRRQREAVGRFVQHRLCPRAGHLARRSGCLYQCELRQSYRLRRLRTRGDRGRRQRRQVSIPGKSTWVPRSTSDRRENDDDFGGAVRRSPFLFRGAGRVGWSRRHRCRAATAGLRRNSAIGPALDASGNSRNYRFSFRSALRSET